MIHFGPEIGADLEAAERKEWLVTNGLGGYAMGTLAGTLTRGYHGLLVAALRPPLGRRLLVTKQDDVVTYQGREVTLAVNRWAADEDELLGFQHLSGFRLEGTIPVWTYVIDDALLEKRLWMRYGENSTYVQFSYIKGDNPLELSTALYLNDRDHHARTNPGDIKFRIRDLANGLEVTTSASAAHIFLLSQDMQAYAYERWSRRFYLSLEHYRGLPDSEAHYMGGQLSGVLKPGESAAFVASTEPNPELDASKAYDEELLRQNELIYAANWIAEVAQPKDSHSPTSISDSAVKQLILAADQFVVRRQTKTQTNGRTIIAGYPWFGDWGRDTMIALPGITLSAGQHRTAANILRTFAEFIDQGMLPNRFPDEDDSPAYNTADATLWYFEALCAYLDETQDLSLIEAIFPALKEIIQWHINGTRHQIKLDPRDGLLFAGEPGVQLTWMDAKVGDWVVTPRIGKPVEINALWYNALLNMATFARLL
ncbi:MAG: amylo-alpha-1,6-glucosidase, partial [Candidatus Promineifilaceae bacterium]